LSAAIICLLQPGQTSPSSAPSPIFRSCSDKSTEPCLLR
jgi:hypothetical protein